MTLKRILRILILTIIFGGSLFYVYNRVSALRNGVDLVVNNLESGQSIEKNYIEITGEAKLARKLTINEREVFLDENGDFKDTVILSPGVNYIDILAIDKFGKESEENFSVYSKSDKTLPTRSNTGPVQQNTPQEDLVTEEIAVVLPEVETTLPTEEEVELDNLDQETQDDTEGL